MYPYENPLKIPKVEKSLSLWTHPDGLVLGSIYLHMPEPDRGTGEDPWSVMNGAEDFLVVRPGQRLAMSHDDAVIRAEPAQG